MPEDEYAWLSRDDLLHFEEISRLVDVFIGLGVDKIRLTGGEPLLRRNLCQLVELLAAKPLADLALTTNGILLAEFAEPLRRAGLKRLNISLDTLQPDRFVQLTRQNDHARVMARHRAAAPRSSPAPSSTRSSCAASTTTSSSRCWTTRRRSAPRSASSSTWTSAAPRTGRPTWWCRAAEMLERLRARFGASRPSRSRDRRRRPIASRCRTAASSASSRRRRSRSAATATARGSRPTASSTRASTRPTASTCGRGCARGAPPDGSAPPIDARWPRRHGPRRRRARRTARARRVRAGHRAARRPAPRDAQARRLKRRAPIASGRSTGVHPASNRVPASSCTTSP